MTSNSLIRKKSIIDALISFVEAPIIFILFFILLFLTLPGSPVNPSVSFFENIFAETKRTDTWLKLILDDAGKYTP